MRYRCVLALLFTFVFSGSPGLAQKTPGGKGTRSTPGPAGTLASSAPPLSGGAAHHAYEESTVDFRSEAVLVQVPVVVTDKQGNHLHGLKKEEFEVYEENKLQKITVFEELKADRARPSLPSTQGDTFTNRLETANRPKSITIFVLDAINTPYLDQAYGRQQLIRYLASNVDPDQSFVLVSLGGRGVRILHGVTQDTGALIEELKKLSGEIPAMQGVSVATLAGAATSSGFGTPVQTSSAGYASLRSWLTDGEEDLAKLQQDQAIEATMRGFLDIAWALSGIPGRKSLVWATGGFPFYLDSPAAVPGGTLSVLYERTMQTMNDAQIAVYPVDVRGLINTVPAADSSARVHPGFGASQSLAARNWLQGITLDTLRDFADMTGGRAFYNTNDVAGSYNRAAADSASYYLIGYSLDTGNRKPGWRSLKVKVHQSGAEVRARNGFFVTNATVNPELSRKLDIGFAIYSPFNSTGIPISIQWTGQGKNQDPDAQDKKTVTFLIRVDGGAVALDSGDKQHLDLDLLAFAFTGKGRETAATFSQNFQTPIAEDQLAKLREKGLGYSSVLKLSAGRYNVRFVVRDNVSGRIGSVSAPVTVN